MLELLFSNKNTEKILFSLLKQQKVYAQGLSKNFNTAVFGIQEALQKLEKAGILVSFLEGKSRFYQFNPRYPFLKELKQFCEKVYEFLPREQKEKYYEKAGRTRPRRAGKPIFLK